MQMCIRDRGQPDKTASFFGRLNYGYKDRYLATVTVRADGSSKFIRGNRWGIFPAAALALSLIHISVLVKAGKGIIDTCPLWDEDGKVYLVHAYAGSRAGLKSVIAICELNADATKAISQSRIVFDGHEAHETCEGPKFYKRGDYYYIFHPAGGVPTGWQVVPVSYTHLDVYKRQSLTCPNPRTSSIKILVGWRYSIFIFCRAEKLLERTYSFCNLS